MAITVEEARHRGVHIGGMVAASGYNGMLFNQKRLRDRVHQVAPALKSFMQEVGATHVAVTGKSGIAMAFALLMHMELSIITVRKPDEKSHGAAVEGDGSEVLRYIVLDDFVASGETVQRVRDAINVWAGYQAARRPELVGVFAYDKQGGAFAPDARRRLRELLGAEVDYRGV